jgi:hypothetical protein
LRYERLTWPEVRRAASEERVALVPVATLEDHGRHLPVDTDLRIVTVICRRAAAEAGDRVVLLPAIPHGYDPHHMDFPGAVTIGWDTFTRYCADVGRSLAHHGFRRMLFLNGHGSNQNLVEMAAGLVTVERPEVLAAAAFYLASPEAAAVITALHVALRQRAGLATFYGPHLWTMGARDTSEFTRGRLLEVLTGGGAGPLPPDPDDPYVRPIRGGRASGPLVGVAIGEMDKCDWSEQRPEWPRTKSLEQVLEEHLEPLGVPVLYKLPVGHAKHLATLPLGVAATLDADARTLTLDKPALR